MGALAAEKASSKAMWVAMPAVMEQSWVERELGFVNASLNKWKCHLMLIQGSGNLILHLAAGDSPEHGR